MLIALGDAVRDTRGPPPTDQERGPGLSRSGVGSGQRPATGGSVTVELAGYFRLRTRCVLVGQRGGLPVVLRKRGTTETRSWLVLSWRILLFVGGHLLLWFVP